MRRKQAKECLIDSGRVDVELCSELLADKAQVRFDCTLTMLKPLLR